MGQGRLKVIPKITVDDHISVPGDTKNLTAKVTVNGIPKAGFVVKFSIDGFKGVGNAATGADGKASLAFTVPDDFAAKVWTVRAKTDATGAFTAGEDTGKLNVIKGATAVVLGDPVWAPVVDVGDPYDPRSPKVGTYVVKVVQKYGGKKTIIAKVKLTLNGVLYNIVEGDENLMMLPYDGTTWEVRAEFEGNGSYTPSEATRTYKKP